jgi:hypothetical protein
MALLLTRLVLAHGDEQLREDLVTLATLGHGQLLPHGGVGQGERALLGMEVEGTLVHHGLLSVAMHKK